VFVVPQAMTSNIHVTRRAVLSLYRSILRTGKTWHDPVEAKWILNEASSVFRQHQHESDAKTIHQLFATGEERHTVAKWSKIPYERPVHLGGGGAEGLSGHKDNPIISKGRKRVNMAGKTVWKDAFSR
jgi:hypothetical protein